MNLLDIILLAIIGICLWDGLRNGLVKQLLDLAGVFIAFIIASRYGAAFGHWLSGFLSLEDYAARLMLGSTEADGLSGIVADIVKDSVPDIIAAFNDALGYILLFLITLAAVKLLAVVIGAVAKLPVLGTLDKIGGFALGFLKGCLIALVAVWILNLLPVPSVMENVESSQIAQSMLTIAPRVYEQVFHFGKYEDILGLVDKVQSVLNP